MWVSARMDRWRLPIRRQWVWHYVSSCAATAASATTATASENVSKELPSTYFVYDRQQWFKHRLQSSRLFRPLSKCLALYKSARFFSMRLPRWLGRTNMLQELRRLPRSMQEWRFLHRSGQRLPLRLRHRLYR